MESVTGIFKFYYNSLCFLRTRVDDIRIEK